MRRRPAVPLLAAALLAPLVAVAPAVALDVAPEPRPTAAPRATDDSCPEQVQEDGFRDVAASNPHERAVDCAFHWRIAQGRADGTYGPGEQVDRAQMAAFVARFVERSGGSLPAATRDHFADDDASPHQDSINRLAEAGIVGGKGARTYAPRDGVTRAQMAAFLVRAYDHRAEQGGQPPLPEGGDHFTDDDGAVLEPEIDRAAAAGFAGGYGDGTYRPGVHVPRDQMAAFLSRALDLVVERGMAAVPAGPRTATVTSFGPYATVGPVTLSAPVDVVEVIGLHESNHDGAQPQTPVRGAPRSLVMESRSRGTSPTGAADVVVDPSREVRSPVTGTVRRAGTYQLYCRYPDHFLVVEPDARPGWEVKLLHFEGLQVSPGQRVEAGVTVVGSRGRVLPFRSQVDDHTVSPHWPHVHVEVVDPSVPDRPGSGGDC